MSVELILVVSCKYNYLLCKPHHNTILYTRYLLRKTLILSWVINYENL